MRLLAALALTLTVAPHAMAQGTPSPARQVVEQVFRLRDRGAWHEARLAAIPDIDTWRQWVFQWQATPGNHLIEARATDKTGYTQTAVQAQPVPNGASGYRVHSCTSAGLGEWCSVCTIGVRHKRVKASDIG